MIELENKITYISAYFLQRETKNNFIPYAQKFLNSATATL